MLNILALIAGMAFLAAAERPHPPAMPPSKNLPACSRIKIFGAVYALGSVHPSVCALLAFLYNLNALAANVSWSMIRGEALRFAHLLFRSG